MRHFKEALKPRRLLYALFGLLTIVFSIDSGARFNLRMILASNTGKILLIFLLTLISIFLFLTDRRAEKLTQSNRKKRHGDQTLDVPGLEDMTTNTGDKPEAKRSGLLEDR